MQFQVSRHDNYVCDALSRHERIYVYDYCPICTCYYVTNNILFRIHDKFSPLAIMKSFSSYQYNNFYKYEDRYVIILHNRLTLFKVLYNHDLSFSHRICLAVLPNNRIAF